MQLIVTAYNGAGSEYHSFDNVLVVEDSGLDTSPPSLVSLSIEDSQTIMAISNEALSSSSLAYTCCYIDFYDDTISGVLNCEINLTGSLI